MDVPALSLKALPVRRREDGSDVPEGVMRGLRPEDFVPDGGATDDGVSLRPEVSESPGGSAFLYSDAWREDAVVATLPLGRLPRAGETVRFRVPADRCSVFAPDGQRL